MLQKPEYIINLLLRFYIVPDCIHFSRLGRRSGVFQITFTFLYSLHRHFHLEAEAVVFVALHRHLHLGAEAVVFVALHRHLHLGAEAVVFVALHRHLHLVLKL